MASRRSLGFTYTAEENVGYVARLVRWDSQPRLRAATDRKVGHEQPRECKTPVRWDSQPHLRAATDRKVGHEQPRECKTPPGDAYPIQQPMGMVRAVSFNTEIVVDKVRRVISSSDERPELTENGTGGVYMIRERSDDGSGVHSGDSARSEGSTPLAVFKPSDEEAGSEHNPRGLVGAEHVMRDGFHAGGGATRERVAYKLDRGFAGMPRTAVDKLLMRTSSGGSLREQSGSIQEFVPSDGDASDFRFDGADFEPSPCHRLALLDCRLFNCDRHEGNILVRASVADLARRVVIPIDHAFCLPAFGFFREAEFAWRYWTCMREPFATDILEHVATWDVAADVELARSEGLDSSSCATLRACTMLVRAAMLGARAGGTRTPKGLSELIMRDDYAVPSPFERMVAEALGLGSAECERDAGLVDYVVGEQRRCGGEDGGCGYVPPPDFFARFAYLLEHEFGPIAIGMS